jgi:hypothetical protein
LILGAIRKPIERINLAREKLNLTLVDFVPGKNDFFDRFLIAGLEPEVTEDHTPLLGGCDPGIDAGRDALALKLGKGAQLLHHQLTFGSPHVEALGHGSECDPPRLQVFHDLQQKDQRPSQPLQASNH